MRMRIAFFAVLLPAILSADPVVRTVAGLSAAMQNPGPQAVPFDIEATVTHTQNGGSDQFAVEQDGVGIMITDSIGGNRAWFSAGDRIRAQGSVHGYATASKIEVLAHGTPPPPQEATVAQISGGEFICRLVRTTGTVIDVFHDEIDPHFLFFVLCSGGEYLYLTARDDWNDADFLARLKGAFVSVTGFCGRPPSHGNRRPLGILVGVRSPDAFRILRPAPADPFSVPDLQGSALDIRRASSSDFPWRKVRGTVIAVRPSGPFFVQTDSRDVAQIQIADGEHPACGDVIEAVGMPETDFHHLNLSRAIWRKAQGESFSFEAAERVSVRFLLTDDSGRRKIKPTYHGRLVTVGGIVQHISTDERGGGTVTLSCGEFIVPVETCAADGLPVGLDKGCEVEVTGVCIMNTRNWRPQMPFPVIEGITVVLQSPAAVRILAHPSKWTPRRLMQVIGVLVAALVGFLVWTILLKRLSDRKGRELARATLERTESELKVHERTRLATELHDTIAQNLTGASMELRAADRHLAIGGQGVRPQLLLALKTIDACRDEIRNCIWDLRSFALDEPLMDDALRRTLEPHLAGVRLAVRFAVPRNRLADNTAHAIICIVRELAINAKRHGHASAVRVAGCIDGGKLLFSVCDDGCGFDPAQAPDASQGHFGLQGISERVDMLHGEMVVASVPGCGARVSVSIPMQKEGRQ